MYIHEKIKFSYIIIGHCLADSHPNPFLHKRCKRQMLGCPGLQSGTGRCTGCHNGSGGIPTSRGCTGCSGPPVITPNRRWHTSATITLPTNRYRNWNSYPRWSGNYNIWSSWYPSGSPSGSSKWSYEDQRIHSTIGSGWRWIV